MTFTLRTPEALWEAGYVSADQLDADTVAGLRAAGVPLVQAGMVNLAGARFKIWAPRWAVQLITGWPLDSTADVDQFLLKSVIRNELGRYRRGEPLDTEHADAWITIAHLGGAAAVQKRLHGLTDDSPAGD